MYEDNLHERKRFDLWVGPEHDRAFFMPTLKHLHDGIEQPEALLDTADGITIMVTGGRVMFSLPFGGQFPQLIVDAEIVRKFLDRVARSVVYIKDERTLLGTIVSK